MVSFHVAVVVVVERNGGGGKGWWEGMWQMMVLMGGSDGIDGHGAVVCAGPGMPVYGSHRIE